MRIAITMPAYNEEGISDFIQELFSTFQSLNLSIIVVDDNSTNSMNMNLNELVENQKLNIKILKNSTNLGHGQSTIIGLKESMTLNPEVIIAVDGDGQFLAEDIKKCFLVLIQGEFDIVEGSRVRRTDPRYRKISSFATKILVKKMCGKTPRDANTPLRLYRPGPLQMILAKMNPDLLTPNLFISTFSRIMNFTVGEIDVISIPRRGNTEIGTSWNQRIKVIPSRRFMKFCLLAFKQWFKIAVPSLK